MSMMDADVAGNSPHTRHLPNSVYAENDWPDRSIPYDANRYANFTLEQIISAARGTALELLKRGAKVTLIARRELGGLLAAASSWITARTTQAELFRRLANLEYSEARRHIKLWVFWPRVEKMLSDREETCLRRGVPFVT